MGLLKKVLLKIYINKFKKKTIILLLMVLSASLLLLLYDHKELKKTHQYNIREVLWNSEIETTFGNADIIRKILKHNSTYCLYADSHVQINVKIDNEYKLEMIGILSSTVVGLVHRDTGIDSYQISNDQSINRIIIDNDAEILILVSKNIKMHVFKNDNDLSIKLRPLEYNTAFGIIGSSIKQLFMDQTKEELDYSKWIDKDNDIFSSLNSSLPQLDFLDKPNAKLNFIMEGPFFDSEGFSTVNRQVFLGFLNLKSINLYIQPGHTFIRSKAPILDIFFVFSLFKRQKIKEFTNATFQNQLIKTIHFRNTYPPNLSKASIDNMYIIHQQPWEYVAIPKFWIDYFKEVPNEIWVPSEYCKTSFAANGIPNSKIHVIPHGVYNHKYRTNLKPLDLPTTKTFKYLAIGSSYSRKGMDILVNAYVSQFNFKDDVTLIIHCTYGLKYAEFVQLVRKYQIDPMSPEIIFMSQEKTHKDMIRLMKSANVYVSAYRSEGFGLSILEAMAAGVPPIVTKYGPSLDFCPPDGTYFVEANETDCLEPTCGKLKIFDADTIMQPRWSEVSKTSLMAKMLEAYEDRHDKLIEKSKICKKHAELYEWSKISDIMLKKIENLTSLDL